MFRPSTIFNSALNYSLALYFIIHPPHWCYSDCLKMQLHPIIMALAKILHQFLKDIWTPLKIFDGNDTLLQNAVAPLLSSDTSVRSSSSLRPLFHADLNSKCCGIHFSFSAAKLLSEPLGIEWWVMWVSWLLRGSSQVMGVDRVSAIKQSLKEISKYNLNICYK